MQEHFDALEPWTPDKPIRIRKAVTNNGDITITSEWGEPVFLRYGTPPPDERSLSLEGEYESGTAVWRAIRTQGDPSRYILCPTAARPSALMTILAAFQRREVYEVEGQLLNTVGGNGEPLLRDLELRPIAREQVVPLAWSIDLHREVIKLWPPLRRRLYRTGEIKLIPRHNEPGWRRDWSGPPDHGDSPNPTPRDLPVRVIEEDSPARLRNVPEMDSIPEFRDEAALKWDELGLPDNPQPEEGWQSCYVRYGDMPEGERSFNWQLGEYEDGVAVFTAHLTPEGEYLLDFLRSPLLAVTYIRLSSAGYRAYRVHGQPCGTGGGG